MRYSAAEIEMLRKMSTENLKCSVSDITFLAASPPLMSLLVTFFVNATPPHPISLSRK